MNRAHWIAFLDRNGQAKYKFGSTQADIHDDSEAGKGLEASRDRIREDDLAGDGKDVGGSHITVRYGVKDGSDPEKLRAFLRNQAPFVATLGATQAFPVSKHSEGAAPIVAPVESEELHRIHHAIARHGDFQASDFADYRPHATVAYVKPEAAQKYTGMQATKGKRFRVDAISLSFRDGTVDRVQLAGKHEAAAVAEPVPNTLMAEKLRAALEKKRGTAATPVPVASTAAKAGTAKPPGAMRVKVSAAMLQPVTGTPEEAEQLDLIRPDLGRWVADYLARNTKDGVTTVATDAAKAMLPAFAADPLKNDGNVVAAAAAIRDGALNTILQSPPDAAKPYALLAVGSPGSGKTTSLALGGERAKVGLKIEAIPDDVSKFVLLLRKILASGRKPIVEWVWAGTPKATAARMMLRAVGDGPRPGIGRVVHTAYMAKAWAGLPKVLEQARKEMGPQVIWLLADNSGPPGTAKVTQDMGAWLRRGEAIKEPNAHAQMEGELDAMERRGKLKGERGKASLAAARLNQPGMPRTEILDVPEGPKDGRADLQHRMRSLAAAKDAGKALADTRGAEEAAWKRAGDTLREDPKAQVPF